MTESKGGGRRALVITLGALVVAALAIGVVKVLDTVGDPDPTAGGLPVSAILPQAQPAVAPFKGLTELHIGVGNSKCLRVAVADSLDERVEGLRGRSDLGPYDGMLFVFQGPSTANFTMSGVPVPLEIGFYGSNGARNSSQLMKPCAKAEPECPVYRAGGGEYEYALETLKGGLPNGALAACSPT
jgi:uncharacterized membrane protein (UPF0127 family)